MSNLILNTSHPFAEREQTYFLDRKLVSIHSNDRDLCKWPNPSHFEIELPENLINVYSLRLINASFPSNLYTFSNSYQNTKINISLVHDINVNNDEARSIFVAYNLGQQTTITISEGYYDPEQLQNELTGKVNAILTSVIQQSAIDNSYNLPPGYVYDKFVVKYDKTTHKFNFINLRDNFTIHADFEIPYSDLPCGQPNVWKNYANWGLPYNLGLGREEYPSMSVRGGLIYYYDNTSYLPSSDNASGDVKMVQSINCADVFGPIQSM